MSDGTTVVLYKSHTFEENSNIYYYLPVNLHVSFNGANPEISLVFFDADGVSEAILHFLLTWGLSASQEAEVNALLNLKLDDSVFVAGPLLVEAAPVSFKITGQSEIVEIMNRIFKQNSNAPLIPGSKLAASFRFSGEETEYVREIIKDPCKVGDGMIAMIFVYKTLVREGYISKPSEHEWILTMSLNGIFKYLRN
jgi:hypothetical protein